MQKFSDFFQCLYPRIQAFFCLAATSGSGSGCSLHDGFKNHDDFGFVSDKIE